MCIVRWLFGGLFFRGVFSYYPAGITICNGIVRNIFCNNTSCPNYNIVSDRNAWHNDSTPANPNIISYYNWCRLSFTKLK